ncbi:MAG: polyprenyl diphosphate synthase, partial [Bacteroidota bacterium]|nr:polyprenyl diphosphate synthase [Bacteroidota bacterium]
DSVRSVITASAEIGVEFLTLYAFSTENWNRPQEEIDSLMNLLVQSITTELNEMHEKGVQLRTIGNTANLPLSCQQALNNAIEQTKNNDRLTLILALSYSSRWEITNAISKIAENIEHNNLSSNEINEELISSYLSTANFPDPELLIRTSGENRISNFLMWQLAYTELLFTDTLWPDFDKECFYKAIVDYQKRERRFGKTTEQLDENEIN